MKKTILIIVIIIGILLIIGLIQNLFFRNTGATMFGAPTNAQYKMASMEMMAEPRAAGAARANDLLSGSNQAGLEYIRNFSLDLTTDEPKTVFRDIRDITTRYNGYVTSTMINQYNGDMNLFVPQDKAQSVIDAITQLDVKVVSQTASIQEVSMVHQDMQARIATLTSIKEQYEILLNEAKKVSDILLITDKIAETDKTIQELTVSNTEMTKQVNYVAIRVSVHRESLIGPDECWHPVDVFYQAMKSLVVVLQTIIAIFIWIIIYVLPLSLIVALLTIAARKAYRKFKKVTT